MDRRAGIAMLRPLTVTLVAVSVLAGCGSTSVAPSPAGAPGATAGAPTATGGDAASIGRSFIGALATGDDAGAEAMEDA
ncbi:MAG TPA: hypothetical protein VN800_00955, partial [Candidatus Acidoferrales bacterium]|nr:hypothetical protein [Candidatus Acidoferrales bacterium]